jgi:hypothetical protein
MRIAEVRVVMSGLTVQPGGRYVAEREFDSALLLSHGNNRSGIAIAAQHGNAIFDRYLLGVVGCLLDE